MCNIFKTCSTLGKSAAPYIYIYIYRERETDRQTDRQTERETERGESFIK